MVAMFATYGAFFAVKALTNPVYGIALTVFYFDQRIRKEGFDIEWMMHEAGMMVPPTPALATDAPPSMPGEGISTFVEPIMETTGKQDRSACPPCPTEVVPPQ
jgi:hypothetical protein